jgi:hypothetical protein
VGGGHEAQGWQEFLAADGVDDWVVLHGGATAVFGVPSLGEAAQLAAAVAHVPIPRARGRCRPGPGRPWLAFWRTDEIHHGAQELQAEVMASGESGAGSR